MSSDPVRQLDYRIQPDRVFTGTSTSLVLEIRNGTAAPISMNPREHRILATFPAGDGGTALSGTVNYTATSTANFTVERVTGTNGYSVRPSGFAARTLAPGDAVLVRFDGVAVNAVIGDARVEILEKLAAGEARTSVTVSKIAKELNVVAWLEKLVVGKGETTRLHWQSYGGTRVRIAGFPDSVVDPACAGADRQPGFRCFPVTGEPPFPGSVEVGISDPSQPQWRYTVTVFTGSGEQKQAEVTLTQHKPEITGFGVGADMVKPSGKVGAMEEVPVLWTTVYGQRASLVTPTDSAGTPVPLNPAATRPFKPGLEAFRAAVSPRQIPAKAEYVLRVSGFREPAEARLSFDLGFAGAAYFKYAKMDTQGNLSDPVWAVTPKGWPGVQAIISTPPYTLTVHGPGGTVQVLYLGPGDTVSPQVQFFDAVPGQGGKKTLRWVTLNATSLRLEPGGYVVPAAQIAKGSYDVTPTQTTEYMLWATSSSSVVVTSSLLVTV